MTHRRLLALVLLVSLQALGLQITAPSRDDTATAAAQSAFANLPLAFEPNLGQAEDSVDFVVHHGQAVTAFSSTGTTTSVGGTQVTMSLTGAAEQQFAGTDELPSKTNYFLGNDQSKWQSDIPNYGKLLAKDVYPGIDLAYYGTNSQLEHDFIVAPGVDYKQIAFGFAGQDDLSLDDNGNLVLKAGDEMLTLNAPVTYQTDTNSKHTIPSSFELNGGTVTVAVADAYDPAKPLIIDPVLSLVYSTYLGGNGDDLGNAIAVDPSGNTYAIGQTTSADFPTSSPFQGSKGAGIDVYITKLNPTGSSLVYATYLGGSGHDIGRGIAVDISGNAYVTGQTGSTNFPTSSPFQAANAGATNVFVAKLNAAGSALTYSTYLGGSANDLGYSIAIDAGGSAYITGSAGSANFPTASPFQGSRVGGPDAFVTKLNAAGSALVYSTYLGGSLTDQGERIAVDSGGNAYVAGWSDSSNFPTASPIQASKAGNDDAIVFKFNPSGSSLVYSTYLGGTAFDHGYGLAIDSSGSAYVVGRTASTNFPTVSPFQSTNAGGADDIFITKVNAAGSVWAYSTYLGGSGDDWGRGVDLDTSGNFYVTGWTSSTNFPTASALQNTNGGGSYDVFVAKFNAAGSSLGYSTYLGGSGDELGYGIALGLNGNANVIGHTASTNFPTSLPYQSTNNGGAYDAFVFQLTEHNVDLEARVNPTLTFTVGSTSCALGALSTTQTRQCTYTMSAATNGQSGYGISYLPAATLTSGGNTITALGSPTASTLNTEQFGLNLAANTAAGSHTATDFGAAPSGGVGAAAANYATANSFKFATAGEQVASSAGPSLATTYTVSTIANIGNTTEAGVYSTMVTFNVVAGY